MTSAHQAGPSQQGNYSIARLALATAYWLKPHRVRHVPALVAGLVGDRLARPAPIPDASRIRKSPPGFAGLADDLSTPVVLEAMSRGFYPQGHWGAMKWWSPPQRAIMDLASVHIAKRFRRTMRGSDMRVAFDTDFAGVIDGCAAPRDPSRPHLTWITPKARTLYTRLYAEGHAHSVEVFDAGNNLVGGLFGVTVGPVFSALSMFHTADNASKFAIVSLYHHLADAGFVAVDHQIMSPWVEALGGTVLARADYAALLVRPGKAQPEPGHWSAKFSLADTAGWSPETPA
ncbi:leucyl/phenylalanyl-tRNA--protein transferase [Pelagibacterium halotolerans]|uniref:Leucyl/phenylalanyl-tRNA--protein transferase n=1 Tax=Pelagibacterium halotolerans (strain DSM 22347 / JCM 15775 / CGMCC 1.7692 / B2) TaxID=1082931 RepID=G4REV8_PELHB|nr:leucyl/phenylalanyl-tRNA--protein transferase [Pelagibacterium halotolerans]AEQ51929.1 leucyl/phenylalanyl-tRNA--protein transferase [Pelagibacterium halotolerans B2]QJR18276.1 GNAT family N-acetyltransferase [Pelagibacterium halotolerans]SEA27276.1 leucyl/phenylalanyl-tRNA--protein transferase [Pelagibacterium halotolerans]